MAQSTQLEDRPFFVEGNIGGGLLLGDRDYLPGGPVGSWSVPIVYGWAFGLTGGYMFNQYLGVYGNWLHARNETRDGSITGLVDRAEGRVDYHTATAGLRLMVPAGFGAIRGDLGVGVIFPYARVAHLEYSPTIAQFGIPVEGTGRRIENYSLGFGAQARVGYQIPVYGPLYAAADAEFTIFQTENAGETTEYQNFVRDFRAPGDFPLDEVVFHGDGAARPHTASIQSLRLLFSIGAAF